MSSLYDIVLLFSPFVFLAGTHLWKLILKQFDDLLVKILIAAAIVSFLLAVIDGETGLTAFLEPSVRDYLYSVIFLVCKI